MRSINYDGCSFSYPEPLFLSVPPEGSGIYAVQVVNRSWQPQQFEPIYFGESEDFDDCEVPHQHHAFGRWCAHPAVQSGELLYVSYLSLPHGRESHRQIEARLVARYRPACNESLGEPAHAAWQRNKVFAGANSFARVDARDEAAD
jgi:hypothetical protein